MFGGLIRPGISFGPEDWRRRRRPHPAPVAADFVERVYRDVVRLDAGGAHLLRRIEWRWGG
jgi:hypothetical protein